MPFARPTLTDLIADAEASFDARIPGADARLRRSILNILARTIAGAVHGLYGYLDWIFRQVFVDTADLAELERHAAIYGFARTSGTFAAGNVTFAGENGRTIPTGSILQRSDGKQFATDADAVIAAGTATAAVTATASGTASNTTAATVLTFVSPVEGVNSEAFVATGGIIGGDDLESDALLRARLLERMRQPPQGGALHDYIAWTKSVAGVTRVWVLPEYNGPGTVGVTFVRDGESPITPSPGEVQAVHDAIYAPELRRRPVTADVSVFAPTLVPQPFTIALDPDTEAIRAAVAAEIADLLVREMAPDGVTKLLLSHVREAISSAAGEVDHTITVPAGDITPAVGQLLTVGTITWL